MLQIRLPLLLALILVGAGCGLNKPPVLPDFQPKARLYLDRATQGVISPDGRLLAFARLDSTGEWSSNIYVRNLENGQDRRLTASPDYDGEPRWSPNSKLLVITARRGGALNLFLLSAEDGVEQQLTWNGGRQADFSPDGQSVVYSSEELGNLDLFVTSPAGGVSRRITNDPGREWFPRYSPDGRWIVFISDARGTDDLWLLERSSGKRLRLTSLPGQELFPCWSPDSKWVVFAHDSGDGGSGRLELFGVEPVEGSEPRALTHCEGLMCQSLYPSFSPDGSTLLLTAITNPLQLRLVSISTEELLPPPSP